jgi:acetyltransferase-like isoleucine patch superfamily enzyme
LLQLLTSPSPYHCE